MKRHRIVLLVASCVVVVLLAAGSLALKVGAADNGYGDVVLFSELLGLISDNYVDPVDADGLLEGAYEGLLSNLDANGAYMTPDEVREWKHGAPAGQADPGVSVVKVQGSFEVTYVAPDSPAADAGVTDGDQIRRIGDRTARSLSLQQARRLLKGEPGSIVRVEILRAQKGFALETLELERAKRSFPAYDLVVQDGVGVLSVHDMTRVVTPALVEELDHLASRGVDRLLLDMRGVSEGGAHEAVALTELFAPKPVLRLKDRAGRIVDSVEGDADRVAWRGSIGVLVNETTAGSAEAVARLLQSAKAARVYGEETYGLGSEPKLFELADGSGLMFSTALWETGSGDTWNEHGVEPDRSIRGEGRPEEVASDQLRRTLEAFTPPPPPPPPPPRAA
jgi:carboxyl-terminal processing protease